MGLENLNLLNNLVYGIFGEPIWFGIIIILLLSYFSIKYDIPKWAFISFIIPFGIWIGHYYLPVWATIILILFVGILIGPRLFRAFRN